MVCTGPPMEACRFVRTCVELRKFEAVSWVVWVSRTLMAR